MARFLMCWEFGGGLGHAGRFKPLAQALLQRGHHVDLMLRDLVQTRSLLSGLGARVLQAPLWLHQTAGIPNPTISLAEILAGNGYLTPGSLAGLVAGWQGAMDLCQPDVVVADYAPTATLAARTRGLPVATVGSGFYLPPDASPLPPFRTWEPIQAGRIAHHDQLVLGTVNTVLGEQGAPPMAKLVEVLRGDLPLLCTWPELDPYRRGPLAAGQHYLGPNFTASGGQQPVWPTGDGPLVFAYVRGSHPDHVPLLQALDKLGCRTLCYMPEVAAGKPAPVVSPRIHYSPGPVNLGQALPQAQLVVSHAGEATLAQTLLAGVPLLLMPTQAEQFLTALRMEESGIGINAATRARPTPYMGLIEQLLHQSTYRENAQALARRHADFSHEHQTQTLVDAFESLL